MIDVFLGNCGGGGNVLGGISGGGGVVSADDDFLASMGTSVLNCRGKIHQFLLNS
jgi:hypothetical protein